MTDVTAGSSGQRNQIQPQQTLTSTAILVGVAAAGMTIFNKDGSYTVSDFGVTIAVALALIAFMGPLARSWPQSGAFAAVLGGCTVPVVGYLIIIGAPLIGKHAPAPGGDVDNIIGTTSWVVAGIAIFFLDLYRNREKPDSTAAAAHKA